MAESLYSEVGLQRIAKIAKQARGTRSYREFEDLSGIPVSTMRRLELVEGKTPLSATLAKLAPYTPYSLEELQAIGMEEYPVSDAKKCSVAEDVLPVVHQLSKLEIVRLVQILVEQLAGLKQESD